MHEIETHEQTMYELRTQTAMLVLIILCNALLLFFTLLAFSLPKDPIDSGSRSATMDASTGTPNTGGTINAEASVGQIRP